MKFKQMTKEERKAEGERLWKELNARGIYTEAQLDKAIQEVGIIDIGFFVTPLPVVSAEGKSNEGDVQQGNSVKKSQINSFL